MRNATRLLFNGYLSQIATLNHVENATLSFNVDPTVQQTLENKIQESSAFLRNINIPLVQEQQGQKLGLGIAGPVASRTDTTSATRQTRDATTLGSDNYFCRHTDFDTHITYARLDAWAKFQDFQTRIRDVIIQRQALDRILIGFNGLSVSATSNPATNPLLQDVNKGWLQKLRENAQERVLSTGANGGTVKIGKGGDYENIDAAVFDLIELIDPWFQDDTNLVAIVGRTLLHDKYFPLINENNKPTEKLASDIVISQKRLGGKQAITVPYVPPNAVLLTRLDNLSIYVQEGGRRRYVKETPERSRIEFYESSNEDYVIEDYGCCALLENIEILPPAVQEVE